MGSFSTNEFKSGLKIILENDPYSIVENEMVKPGKGQAFNRVKVRNLKTGRVIERTFKSGDSVEAADVVETEMQYLYTDGEFWHFMVPDTFEQFTAGKEAMGEGAIWLKDGMECTVMLWNGVPLNVTPPAHVELAAFTLEEPPWFGRRAMGSAVHASSLRKQGVVVRAMLALEMIGYFTDAPASQEYPLPILKLFYPSRGNFIGVAGKLGQGALVRRVSRAMRRASPLPVRSIAAPRSLPGIELSDHRCFWDAGYQAVMITDTAFYRNPNYHTEDDTPETLDYERMAMAVRGVYAAALAEAEQILYERGILNVPDFIANAGGVICAAVEYHGGSEADALERIAGQIRRNTEEVLTRSRDRKITPRKAAVEMATERVRTAMSYRACT